MAQQFNAPNFEIPESEEMDDYHLTTPDLEEEGLSSGRQSSASSRYSREDFVSPWMNTAAGGQAMRRDVRRYGVSIASWDPQSLDSRLPESNIQHSTGNSIQPQRRNHPQEEFTLFPTSPGLSHQSDRYSRPPLPFPGHFSIGSSGEMHSFSGVRPVRVYYAQPPPSQSFCWSPAPSPPSPPPPPSNCLTTTSAPGIQHYHYSPTPRLSLEAPSQSRFSLDDDEHKQINKSRTRLNCSTCQGGIYGDDEAGCNCSLRLKILRAMLGPRDPKLKQAAEERRSIMRENKRGSRRNTKANGNVYSQSTIDPFLPPAPPNTPFQEDDSICKSQGPKTEQIETPIGTETASRGDRLRGTVSVCVHRPTGPLEKPGNWLGKWRARRMMVASNAGRVY